MMRLRSLMLSTLVLAGMTWSYNLSAQDEDIERWKLSTWRMALSLDAPSLVPPAVQWTIFDEDPVPGFRARAKRMKGYHAEQLERAEDDAKKQLARSSQMAVSWDLGFKEVAGDKVYLLTSAPGVSHGFSSNTPAGKKWIATKIAQIKGKPVCWYIPVTVETGKEIQIMLTEDNMFDLESAFDKVMEEEE